MKKLILILSLFLTFSINAFSQDESMDLFKDFLDNHYKGGEKAFLELFYTNIKFPIRARENCISGVSSMTINFGRRGRMLGIEQKYPLDYGIEQQISRVTELTENNWTSNTQDTSFTFTVAFITGEKEKLNADIKVIAYGMPQYKKCPTTKDFEKKLKKALKKGKYEEAKEYCEELLQRHPFSEDYLEYEVVIKELLKE